MDFGPVAVAQAEGCILAHSLDVNGKKLPKGTVLQQEQLEKLRDAGIETVTVAQLGNEDVHEDAAAYALGQAFSNPQLRIGMAQKGRVNIHAACDGVLQIDIQAIKAINNVSEAITLATLHPFQRVEAGQLLATIKIITFAVLKAELEDAVGRVHMNTMRISAFKPRQAALLLTHGRLGPLPSKLRDKTINAVKSRLKERGTELDKVIDCPHEIASVQKALGSCETHDLILMMGISAIVDRRDVLPAALVHAGGHIDRFGMAVDPGNLTLLGRLESSDIIGMPGCARSPKLNGFDWVLDRICAGLRISDDDWADMSIGGLLKEISSRPEPRILTEPSTRKVQAIILAAGMSSRMGAENKLLKPIQGKALLSHVLDAIQNTLVDDYIVITGHQAEHISTLVGPKTLFCKNYEDGMAESLKSGVHHFCDADGLMICLGDMPYVTNAHMNKLIDAFNAYEGRRICIASYRGKRGNPVIIPKAYFEDILALQGDQGARQLFTRYADQVELIEMDDEAVLQDFDDPNAFQ